VATTAPAEPHFGSYFGGAHAPCCAERRCTPTSICGRVRVDHRRSCAGLADITRHGIVSPFVTGLFTRYAPALADRLCAYCYHCGHNTHTWRRVAGGLDAGYAAPRSAMLFGSCWHACPRCWPWRCSLLLHDSTPLFHPPPTPPPPPPTGKKRLIFHFCCTACHASLVRTCHLGLVSSSVGGHGILTVHLFAHYTTGPPLRATFCKHTHTAT